ncbi:putative mitochondrial protein [Glycine soja]
MSRVSLAIDAILPPKGIGLKTPRILGQRCKRRLAQNFVLFSPSPFIHLLLPPSSYPWPPMVTHLLLEVASPLSLPSPFHCHLSSKKQMNPLMKKILGLQAPMELTSCGIRASSSSVNGKGTSHKDPLSRILDELSSLKLWKEKLERKEKEKERVKINQDEREQIREEERRKILKELRKEKHASYSSHNSCKSLSEELRDYYEGRHRSHLRPHSHMREKERKPQEVNINLPYFHGKDNLEANLDWEIRVEQQLKRKPTSKFYGSHSYPKKDKGQGILEVTPSKPKDDKGNTIEKQPLKASMQEKTSSMKCYKCLGRGHITSQCPTKKTMIMRGQDIYSSQDEVTTSPSSSESEEAKGEESSEEIYPQEEGQPLMVKEECKEVSVSSKRLAKKESHFEIKTNIKETYPLRQPPHFLLCKKTLVSIVTPLRLEFIPQVKKLLDEGLVRKSLNPCALLVPKIGIIRHQIPMIGGMINVLSGAKLFCKITHVPNIFMICVHRDSLGRFALIFCFNANLGAHVRHLRNNQHENQEKGTFYSITFLNFFNSDQGLPKDPKRIKVIPEWPTPPSIREIWGFNILTNFYKRFVPYFPILVAPLIELVRNYILLWEDGQEKGFQSLPYSKLPNITNTYGEGVMQSYPPRALDRRLQEDWTKDAREGPRVLMSLRSSFRAQNFVLFSPSPFIHLLLPPSSYPWPPMVTHLLLEVASLLSLPSPLRCHLSSKKQNNPLMKKILGLQAPMELTSAIIGASSPSFISKAHLGGEAPSSMAYSLVDGASSHLFSFVFRCISMDLIEAQRSNLHRSPTSNLPSSAEWRRKRERRCHFKEKMSLEEAHYHRRSWIRAWRKKEMNEGRGREEHEILAFSCISSPIFLESSIQCPCRMKERKQERKDKGKKRVEEISQDERKKIREEETRKIMKEMKREKHASYSSHNSYKSLSEELRDYYEGRHRSHLRPHSHRREKERKPQKANIRLSYFHGKDNVEANLDWEIRVEQQLKKKSTSKSYGSHSYPKKDKGQGILGVTPSKPKDDKGKTIEKQALKASMQEKTSSINSQDKVTTSPSSSESEEAKGEESSEEIYPQEEGQPLVVKEKCKEVSVFSKSLAKKETHFTIKTNIKETFPLRQPPHFLFCKKTLASIATPLGLEFIPQVKKLLDEGLVRKSLNPCALLVPKIGVEGRSPEYEEPRDLSSFFQGLFPSGWRLLSPILLCLSLHLHGGKSPVKDLIEAQRSNLHRSSTSKIPSLYNTANQENRCLISPFLLLHSFATDLQEAKDSIDEEDPRPTSST